MKKKYEFTDEELEWLKQHGFKMYGLDHAEYEKDNLCIRIFILSTGFYCNIIRFIKSEDFIGRDESMLGAIERAFILLSEQMENERKSFEEVKRLLGKKES